MHELIRPERHLDHRYTTETECAYCETLVPSEVSCYVLRVSYGWANNKLVPFCSRACLSLYRERGPEWPDRDDRDRDAHPGPNRTLSEFRPDPASSNSSSSAVATTAGP